MAIEFNKTAKSKKYQEAKLAARYKESNVKPFRVESFERLIENNGELLLAYIKEFVETRVPRYDRLDDYYMAENTAIYAKPPRADSYDADKPDARVSHSFAEFISSFLTSFIAGKPITYVVEGNEEEESDDLMLAIEEFNHDNDIDLHNYTVFSDSSIYGEGNELMYRTVEGGKDIDKVTVLPRMNSFIIYDMTLENNEIAGVYFIAHKVGDEVNNYVTVYSDTTVMQSEPYKKGDTKIYFKPAELHPYGEVPMTSFMNNRFRIGDYERVIPLIDAYDSAVSDTTNYMGDLTDAVLAISGHLNANLTDEQVNMLRKARILLLGHTTNPTNNSFIPADAKYLYKQYDVQGVEAHKSRIENDIHKLSYTPNFNDENFGGNLSGEALSYKLVGLNQARAAKENYYSKGLAKRYRMLANAKSISADKLKQLKFKFHENLPKAVLEELKAYATAGGTMSTETMLSLLSFIQSPAEEMERMEKEEIEEIERFEIPSY